MELSILEGFLEEAKGGYAFQWEEPHCKAGKILLRGGVAVGQPPCVVGKTSHKHSPEYLWNICVVRAEPFLGSAGGGWWADLLWNLCLGPLPGTIFL